MQNGWQIEQKGIVFRTVYYAWWWPFGPVYGIGPTGGSVLGPMIFHDLRDAKKALDLKLETWKEVDSGAK